MAAKKDASDKGTQIRGRVYSCVYPTSWEQIQKIPPRQRFAFVMSECEAMGVLRRSGMQATTMQQAPEPVPLPKPSVRRGLRSAVLAGGYDALTTADAKES